MKFLKAMFSHYLKSDTFEKGAALSYYVAFSFLPMIVIVISVLGIIFKEDTVSEELIRQLAMYIGDQAAHQFETMVNNQHLNYNNTLATLLGFVALALASTGGLRQLQRSLNSIWGIKEKPKSSILNYVLRNITFFFILIILGFILILSATIGRFIMKYASNLPDAFANARLYETLISILLIACTLIVLFKFLGSAKVVWKNALVSAGFTTILFLAGKEAITIYIVHSQLSTTFGAASIIALLMIWVFYTAQILFLGACFAYVYGQRNGCEITPGDQAVQVIEKEIS